MLTLHLMLPETRGDQSCLEDGLGEHPPFSPVFQDFTIDMSFTGGFVPLVVPLSHSAAVLANLVTGPDGQIWALDQGDTIGPTARGRLFRINPAAASEQTPYAE
jgi:hypothetical protein